MKIPRHSFLFALVLSTLAVATPVDSPYDTLPPLPRAAENAVTPLIPGRSRTVDLLIEMQDKNGALSIEERSQLQERAAGRSSGAPVPLRASPGPAFLVASNSSSSGLFGSGANTVAATKEVKIGNTDLKLLPITGIQSDNVPQTPSADRQQTTESGGRLPLSGEVLQFFRKNRELVGLAAVAALVLVWIGSAAATQRRR